MHKHKQQQTVCLCLAFLMFFFSFFIHDTFASAGPTSEAVVHTFDIGMRPTAYEKMISDESEPVFSVSVSVDGGSYSRGNIKLRGNASKGTGLLMPTKRIPIQLTFQRTDPIKKTLNNSCVKLINSLTPYRLLAEYMALDVFAFCGIPTPAHGFAFLRYNDVDFGLYLAVEDVNGEFLAKNFPNGSGSLFKEAQKDFSQDYSISNWFGSLYMTVDNGSDRIMALLDALDRGEGYEDYLDVDEFLRFFACLAVDGAASSFLTEQNNFFLYDNGEKFMLLPWDNSDAFGAYPNENNIDFFRMDPWEDYVYPPPVFTLLMEDEKNRETYHNYIKELNDTFLAPEHIDPYLNSLAALVQPYLERDPTILLNEPYSLPIRPSEGFGTVNVLLNTIHKIHLNLSDQLSGKTQAYYYNPVYFGNEDFPEGVMLQDNIEKIMGYYVKQTPNYDPEITQKICDAYPEWCRRTGNSPLYTDDPAEIAVCAAVFTGTFLLLLLLTRKRTKRRKVDNGST